MSEAVDDPTEHDPTPESGEAPASSHAAADAADDGAERLGEIDIAGIEADLDGVQAALGRLADGTYWTDEVTGEPIPIEVLVDDPLARRA